MQKIKLLFYYLLVAKLPHSRLVPFCNKIRVWYVAKILGLMQVGSVDYFEPNIYIGSGSTLRIGKNCQINENVFIQGAYIGDHVMIAPNVAILTTSHVFSDVKQPMGFTR